MSFRYVRDPLFVASSACYSINRWILKPRIDSIFLRSWLNDLLLIPCALPVLFWVFRALRLRTGDQPPSIRECAWILIVWSLLFEWIGPRIIPWTTADWIDVLMYWSGGLVAWAFWNRAG